MDRDTIHEKPPISFLFFFSGFPLVDSFLESTHGLLSVVQDEVHGLWLDSITHHTTSLMGGKIMPGFAALLGYHDYHRRQLDVSLPYIENCSSPLVLIVAVLLPSTSKLIIFLTSARFELTVAHSAASATGKPNLSSPHMNNPNAILSHLANPSPSLVHIDAIEPPSTSNLAIFLPSTSFDPISASSATGKPKFFHI